MRHAILYRRSFRSSNAAILGKACKRHLIQNAFFELPMVDIKLALLVINLFSSALFLTLFLGDITKGDNLPFGMMRADVKNEVLCANINYNILKL
jgi:hypothetical protein